MMAGLLLRSAERAVPDAGAAIEIAVVEAASNPLFGLFLHECCPFLVVAGEPAELPFGGINGWNLIGSRIAQARGRADGWLIDVVVHGDATTSVALIASHGKWMIMEAEAIRGVADRVELIFGPHFMR